jgi:hypothetical protein
MGAHSIDRQFGNYWAQLSAEQKQSLLTFILSFYEEKRRDEIDMNKLQEPDAAYYVPWQIFKPLNKQQKKALIAFLQSSGIEPEGRISIEQYNKELDEAMARMDAGEGIPHEEVIEMSKKWVRGN